MDPSSDTAAAPLADLVRRAKAGEEAAQCALILIYQRRIGSFLQAIVGRSDSVEDLTQTVFIKMVRGLDRLHDSARFEAWLFRLARNAGIDFLRRQRLRKIFTPLALGHENIPESSGAMAREQMDELHYALSHLVPRDQVLLALAQERHSEEEIARITGTTVPLMKARLYRARQRLRKRYKPFDGA